MWLVNVCEKKPKQKEIKIKKMINVSHEGRSVKPVVIAATDTDVLFY